MSTLHLDHLIQNAGFELVRHGKHRIYHHVELNKILVTASTPSDQRAEANIIAQVARLSGRKKRELLGGSNKKNPKSTKPSPVVIASSESASVLKTTVAGTPELTVEEAITAAAPLTASERKYLRRLEKHEAQRREKEARQRKKYQYWLAAAHAHLVKVVDEYRLTLSDDKIDDQYEAAAVVLYLIARKAGHYDAELMVADCKTDETNSTLFVIRVGRCYLDLFSATVRDSPRWTIALGESTAQVEVWGSLRVDVEKDGYVIGDSDI